MIFLLLAMAQWVPVSGDWQYFRYWGENGKARAIEHSNLHPRVYHFLGPPAPERTVCKIENRPGVYWFTPDGRGLNGTYPAPNPGEFNVSARLNGIRGFAVAAAFGGSAARAGAVETVYFTDRACSDGGTEYGFARDLATNSVLVYWSTFSNCSNDAASLCRKTDSPALGKDYSNVRQENSGTNVEHGFRIYGLDVNAQYTYRVSTKDRGFRVEVSRDGKLAQCADREGAKAGECAFDKIVQPWFPLQKVDSGYLTIGTQSAGDPGITRGSEFAVADIFVAR